MSDLAWACTFVGATPEQVWRGVMETGCQEMVEWMQVHDTQPTLVRLGGARADKELGIGLSARLGIPAVVERKFSEPIECSFRSLMDCGIELYWEGVEVDGSAFVIVAPGAPDIRAPTEEALEALRRLGREGVVRRLAEGLRGLFEQAMHLPTERDAGGFSNWSGLPWREHDDERPWSFLVADASLDTVELAACKVLVRAGHGLIVDGDPDPLEITLRARRCGDVSCVEIAAEAFAEGLDADVLSRELARPILAEQWARQRALHHDGELWLEESEVPGERRVVRVHPKLAPRPRAGDELSDVRSWTRRAVIDTLGPLAAALFSFDPDGPVSRSRTLLFRRAPGSNKTFAQRLYDRTRANAPASLREAVDGSDDIPF